MNCTLAARIRSGGGSVERIDFDIGGTVTFCENCQALEGDTTEVIDENDETITVCAQCGSDEIKLIPEHDDYDLER